MAYPTAVNNQITDAVTQANIGRKYRLVVIAFVLGAALASAIAKRRQEQSPVTPPSE